MVVGDVRGGRGWGWSGALAAVALGPERLPVRGGPPAPLVVGHLEAPAAAMRDAVVVPAQQDHAGDIGAPALVPVIDMMRVAPPAGRVAPRERAPAVAFGHGAALVLTRVAGQPA